MAEIVLDCRGMMCPMPIVKLAKKIREVDSGQVIEMIADDVGSKEDVPAWCKRTGHELMDQKGEGGVFYYYIKKK